jgi:hypothetical protein
MPDVVRLVATDADFVDVYHTNCPEVPVKNFLGTVYASSS